MRVYYAPKWVLFFSPEILVPLFIVYTINPWMRVHVRNFERMKNERNEKLEHVYVCARTFFGFNKNSAHICCSFSLHRQSKFLLLLLLFGYGFYYIGNIAHICIHVRSVRSFLFFFIFSMENLPRVCFYDVFVHVCMVLTFLQILGLLSKEKGA